jgi:hypothetical protein
MEDDSTYFSRSDVLGQNYISPEPRDFQLGVPWPR